MKEITKKKFILTIEVDNKNILKKYPNYKFNYSSPDEFIKSIANDIQFIAGMDMSKKGMKNWGYSIKIKELKEK